MTTRRTDTRACAAGVRPGVLERKARKFVAATRAKLQAIAYDWADLYTPMSDDCTALERELDAFEERLAEAIEYIKMPVGSE